MSSVVFAHQGGWDEFLMVAGPLLFLCLVVWLAARRFKTAEDDTEETFNYPRDTHPRDPIEEPVP